MSDNQIGLVYDVLTKPERWPELLESLAESIDKNEGEDSILMYHFRQALSIAEKINKISQQRDSLVSLIDRLQNGVLLVDANSKISVKNKQADFLMNKFHGISSRDGKVVCSFHDDTNSLHQLVKELSIPKAMLSVSRGMTVRCKSCEEQNVKLSLVPIGHTPFSDYGLSNASVIIFINSEMNKLSVYTDAFKENYSLTNSQNKVLERLVNGHSINDIAEQFENNVETIRSHRKELLRKTATHSQSELISLVYSDPGNIMANSNKLFEEPKNKMDYLSTLATPESMEYDRLLLSDGRSMAYKVYGDKMGTPVFFAHSAKGSRFQVPPIDAVLYSAHIRLIVPDRPGYGLSDPLPGRTVYSWPDDLIELAEKLNIEKFYISGYSTGAGYALATAHKYPDRVLGVLVIGGGVNPTTREALVGMLPVHKMVFYLAFGKPDIYTAFMKLMTKGILDYPDLYIEEMSNTLCEKDVETFKSPHIRKQYKKTAFECGRQGAEAGYRDILFSANPPEFEYNEIKVPTQIWHGELDQNLPLHLAKELANQLEFSELKVIPGHGHMMFYSLFGEALLALINMPKN